MDVTGTPDGLIKLSSPASHAGNRGSIPLGATLNPFILDSYKLPVSTVCQSGVKLLASKGSTYLFPELLYCCSQASW